MKYAIYSSETGLNYFEYHESLESLKGTKFDGIITEDKLPVVLDGKGGYFKFDKDDFRFEKLVESDGCPLRLEQMYYKNLDDFKLGWMSPDGDTYSCDYTSHTKAAIKIAEKYLPRFQVSGEGARQGRLAQDHRFLGRYTERAWAVCVFAFRKDNQKAG